MKAWAPLQMFIMALMIGIAVTLGVVIGIDEADYATIGGHRVPALECQEDELITWVQAKLGCAPIEYYQEVK